MIDKSTPLPEVFTLCSLFKEELISGDSFFTIYGSSGDHWLSLSNWAAGQVNMWLKINTLWLKIRELPPHWMNSWIHICIEVDIVSGNLSISINEEPPIFVHEIELTAPK